MADIELQRIQPGDDQDVAAQKIYDNDNKVLKFVGKALMLKLSK